MQFFKVLVRAPLLAVLIAGGAAAQSPTNLEAFRLLAPVAALGGTDAGKAALAANLDITGKIQSGAAKQPLLLPFTEQQQQALKDALISNVGTELADGLGSKLAPAYQALVKMSECSSTGFAITLPAVARLISFANATSYFDSNAAKYFFANATLKGDQPVSDQALAILSGVAGETNIFGKSYPPSPDPIGGDACSAKANPFGNPRPFETEPNLAAYDAEDFCGAETNNAAYLCGPKQNLVASPSYPSGHTTYGYMESMLLALLVPGRYQEMVTRAAEYGNDRIVLGAHYAMDVLGGRTLALYDLAQLLANKPGYVGVEREVMGNRHIRIDDFREALAAARADLEQALEEKCGGALRACVSDDQSRFADQARNEAFYAATQTYDLPQVYAGNPDVKEDVAKLAPEAGYLLTVAFPSLTLEEADAILTLTEGPGGGFLDDGSSLGVYSRLDLYHAAARAAALTAKQP